MADQLLLQKVEQAIASVLTPVCAALSPAVSVHEGKSALEKDELPLVICSASSSGEDDPPFSGNKWITAEVLVKYNAFDMDGADAVAASNTLTAAIQNALRDTDLAATLSTAISNFHCYTVINDGEQREQADGNWEESYSLKVYCCPADG